MFNVMLVITVYAFLFLLLYACVLFGIRIGRWQIARSGTHEIGVVSVAEGTYYCFHFIYHY